MSRKSLSIKEKKNLITEFDKSNLNQKDFAASKNMSASSLRTILKKRDEFLKDNGLVTNEISSLDSLVDDHIAQKERENEDEDDAESTVITAPKIDDVLGALKTIRAFFYCNTEVEDETFRDINRLENYVFKKSLGVLKQKKYTIFSK